MLLSLGTNDANKVCAPADVRAIARLLGFTHPELITNRTIKSVLSKGLARMSFVGVVRRKVIKVNEQNANEEEFEFIDD